MQFLFPLVYILYLRLAAASDKVYSYSPFDQPKTGLKN